MLTFASIIFILLSPYIRKRSHVKFRNNNE